MSDPKSFLPLSPAVFHILVALSEGEKHGYAIMREVDELSSGVVKMGPGTLYGSIKRMLDSDLIEESDERPDPDLDDERRRYYRMTPLGERVVAAEAARLARLLREAERRRLVPRAVGAEG